MEEAKNYNCWISSLCKEYLFGTILEVGSGIGTFTKEWLEIDNIDYVVALEIGGNCISELEYRLSHRNNLSIVNQDVCALNDKYYNYFDAVVSINVLEHIEEEEKALQNIYLSLKKNGYFVLYLPAFQSIFGRTDQELSHFRRYKVI